MENDSRRKDKDVDLLDGDASMEFPRFHFRNESISLLLNEFLEQ